MGTSLPKHFDLIIFKVATGIRQTFILRTVNQPATVCWAETDPCYEMLQQRPSWRHTDRLAAPKQWTVNNVYSQEYWWNISHLNSSAGICVRANLERTVCCFAVFIDFQIRQGGSIQRYHKTHTCTHAHMVTGVQSVARKAQISTSSSGLDTSFEC